MSSRLLKRSRPDMMSPVYGIDDLPGEIITEILNHLPTKDAVATSILSQKWRYRWKQVTTFDVEGRNIMEWIEKGLPQLKAESICKYRIRWSDGNTVPYFPVCKMLGALKVLDLSCYQSIYIGLPQAIYSCKALEVMKLEGKFALDFDCETIGALEFERKFSLDLDSLWKIEVCLPRLVELELNWVQFVYEENISKLVSNSPVLQSLTIRRRFYCDWNLTVSSLSLKRLHICFELEENYQCCWYQNTRQPQASCRKLRIDATDAPAIKDLVLHDSASTDISIDGFSSVDEVDLDLLNNESPSMIVGVLEALRGAKFLKLSGNIMTAITDATRTLSASFERLVKLSVEYDHFSHSQCRLVELIDRCVALQGLEINYSPSGTKGTPDSGTPRTTPRFLSGLKQVTFKQVTRFDLIIKLVLNHGLMLETCDLSWFGATSRETRDKILERVFVNKASPTCKIFVRN